MKRDNGYSYKIIGVLAALTALFLVSGTSGAEVRTITAGTYRQLHDSLKSINPDGADYDTYKDDEVLILLTGDLDVNDLGSALGDTSDEDTGATLTISRPNVTIDGNNHTITSRGYPAFHVEGTTAETDDPLGGIVIRNVTVDGAAYELKLGGGMFFENKADITLRNSTIKNGGAKRGGGGGFYAGPHGPNPYGPTVTIENCVFEGNTSAEAWGSSGGAILGYYAKLKISDSKFIGNKAPLGGAISLYGKGASLEVTDDSEFTDNEASNSGGAIHVFYGSTPTTGRAGNTSITTKDISANVTAKFNGNRANVTGTEDYVFGVAYDPATYADSDIGEPVTSSLTVNSEVISPTYFSGADRSKIAAPLIRISTYEELQNALGYCKYVDGDFEKDDGGHGIVTEGTAEDGDIIYLAGDIESRSTNPDAAVTDDITGATIYIAKNVSIFGNGHEIYGKGFPVFNIEGGTDDEQELAVNIANLKVRDGGYNYKLGGAVFVEGNSLLNVTGSAFIDCTAGRSGTDGSIAGGGGAIYLEPHGKGTPKLNAVRSAFTGNKAPGGTGGAISSYMGNITINSCQFDGNSAATGGAIGAKAKGILNVLAGNTFINNSAAYTGGAIDIQHGRSYYKARGENVLSADARIESTFTGISTFEENKAKWGDKVSFSRYYDSNYSGDRNEPPTITFGPAAGASLDITIVSDIEFDDIYRTTPAKENGEKEDEDKISGGSSGGCEAGSSAAAIVSTAAAIRVMKARKGQ